LASSNRNSDIIPRACAYLAKIPPAIEGQHGDNHTLSTACKIVRGFDLPKGIAMELLLEWNRGCQPPWTAAEIEEKIDSAIKYGTEPIGYLRDKAFNPMQPHEESSIPEKPVILDPGNPVPSARIYTERFHMDGKVLALRQECSIGTGEPAIRKLMNTK
jgi:hypothetical protein